MLARTRALGVAIKDPQARRPATDLASRLRPPRLRVDRSSGRTIGVLLGYLVVAVLLFANVWQSPATRWVGGRIDPPLFLWDLAHAPHAVLHGRNPLIVDSINYPAGANEMWNTSIVAAGLLFAPVTFVLGPIVSFNLFITVAVALSGFAAYMLARRLGISVAGSATAGLLFELSPYLSAHEVAHANLTWVVFVPILFLLLHELVVRQQWHWMRTGLLLGITGAIQLLVSEEVLASSVVAAGITVVILSVMARHAVRRRARYVMAAMGMAAISFLALAGYPLLVQFFGPQRYSGIVQPAALFPADVLNIVIPTHQLLSARVSWPVNTYEMNEYLGIPLLLCLLVGAVRLWRLPLVRVVVAACCVFVALALGPTLYVGGATHGAPLPWSVIDRVPLLRDMLPVRLMLYVDLGAVLLVGVFLDGLRRTRFRTLQVAGFGCLLLVVASWIPSLPREWSNADVPAFFQGGDVSRIPEGGVVLVLPWITGSPDNSPMVWQATATFRYRVPDGYFLGPDENGNAIYGALPSDLSRALVSIENGAPPPQLTPSVRASMLTYLHEHDVRSVFVGPMRYRSEVTELMASLLGAPAGISGGITAWWTVPES